MMAKGKRRYTYAELGEMFVDGEWGHDITALEAEAQLKEARSEDEVSYMLAALLRLAKPVLLREKAKIEEERFQAERQIGDAGKALWIAWEEKYGQIRPRHCRAYVKLQAAHYVYKNTRVMMEAMKFEAAVRMVREWANWLSPWNIGITEKARASYPAWKAWCEGKYAPKKKGDAKR